MKKNINMKTWIALLKSINVGGNNILPMKELRAIGNTLGYHNFRTYIQTGNCIFSSTKTNPNTISEEIADSVFKNFDFRPPIITISTDVLKTAIELNPYKVDPSKGNTVHFHFLWSENTEFNEIEANRLSISSEEFKLIGSILYMHAPEGVGRSKLFAKLPKLLSSNVTVRNLKTMLKVYDIAKN